MTRNSKQTSQKVASVAGETLQSSSSSGIQKTLAGSALRQARSPAQTGAKTEDAASKALRNDNAAPATKTLAGSVVSQSNRRR